jgi:hypothetical protein
MDISDVSKFKLSYHCLPVAVTKKSQKHSLSFIMNEDDEDDNIMNEDKDEDDYNNNIILKYSKDLSDCIDAIPDLLQQPYEKFEKEKEARCTHLAKTIIDIYNISSNDYLTADNLRRRQFRYHLLI